MSAQPKRPRQGIAAIFALLGVLILAMAGWMWLSPGLSQRVTGQAGIGGPFELVNGDGKTVTDRAWPGKYLLVYFGYTFCPDVCPTTLNEMAGALEQLGPKANLLQPLFITVDPKRDTPDAVKQFAAAFSPRLVGLTGTQDQIAKAARAYRVFFKVHAPKDGEKADEYTVDHSSIIYLMGPDGRFIAPIRADLPADAMAKDIARHLS